MLPLLLLLVLLQLSYPVASQATEHHLCDGEELRSILRNVDLASCLANAESDGGQSQQDCSLMSHFEKLAEGKSLDDLMRRVTIVIFAHSKFITELKVPGNPALEIEPDLVRHNAYIGVTKCMKAPNSTCQRLRLACFGGFVSQFVFLVSGHCSKSWGCSPIYPNERSEPAALLNMLPYIHYRVIERQAFVAKELGELQLSTSTGTEYLIQTELNDTYGSQLISSNSPMPVAVFVAGPVMTLTYYQQLVWFLDAAMRLRDLYAFHVIVTPLSLLEVESERPLYRWNVQEHQSFLAVYTKQLCSSNPAWAFACKPAIVMSSELLFAEQYATFMLHAAIKDASLPGTPYPALKAPTKHLIAFVRQSTSYVLSVMPVDEMLTDRMINWEVLKALIPYLGSSFGITYYPVIVSKANALQILKGLNTGLDLEQAFYRPSFFIRLPTGAYAVLKLDEPIAVLDKTVRDSSKDGNYQVLLQSTREMLNERDTAELPSKMTTSGHIAGDVTWSDEETKEIVDETRLKNRTDAFVEQQSFKGVYNVTNVLVIESDTALMRSFFDKLGKDKPWLVLFTVSWSPLCKAARAAWSGVGDCARRLGFPDVQLVKVDCFEANEICQRLGVTTYPTVSAFSKGVQLNTYSGPVISDDLCLYNKLAFEPPVLASSSEKETELVLGKLLSIKSRAFVFRGREVPSPLTVLAKSLRFREVFVHEKTPSNSDSQLMAVYRDVKPKESRYVGSLDDRQGLLDFVENGHIDSVFPCTWTYLPQALRREDRPLAILFHLDGKATNEAAIPPLLDNLSVKFAKRATLCHLNLRHFAHLSELVQRLAGLSLPALVVLSKQPGSSQKFTYRLPLGAVPPAELPSKTVDWLELALAHRLTDGRPVEPSEPWQPASRVFNFVDQVYRGKPGLNANPGQDQRPHRSRPFTVDATEPERGSGRGDGNIDEEDNAKRPSMETRTLPPEMMMSGEVPSRDSTRDEL